MNKNSLLTMSSLSEEEIIAILADALKFSKEYRDWQFSKPKLVANLFLNQVPVPTIHLPVLNCS